MGVVVTIQDMSEVGVLFQGSFEEPKKVNEMDVFLGITPQKSIPLFASDDDGEYESDEYDDSNDMLRTGRDGDGSPNSDLDFDDCF